MRDWHQLHISFDKTALDKWTGKTLSTGVAALQDPFWVSSSFNTVVCLKWRHQQSRFEHVFRALFGQGLILHFQCVCRCVCIKPTCWPRGLFLLAQASSARKASALKVLLFWCFTGTSFTFPSTRQCLTCPASQVLIAVWLYESRSFSCVHNLAWDSQRQLAEHVVNIYFLCHSWST